MTQTKYNTESSNLDDSEFNSEEISTRLNLGNIFSGEFSNITTLYTSPHGCTQLYTATRYGKLYLLKGLKEEYQEDPVFLMALLKEFEIGITLDHPNIRRTIGIENLPTLGRVVILEYIDGETLDSLINSDKISPTFATHIVGEILNALEYMHSKSIYHRDLKPSNILISYNSRQVKIIDFNLSDSNEFVVLKKPAGTLRYMAPEQQLENARPSAATDIYSFGVILNDIALAIQNRLLSKLAKQCCNQDPSQRPDSIQKIRENENLNFNPSIGFRLLSSSILTYLLIGCALALTVLIIYLLRL